MKPTIIIEDDVYKKVMHWVNKSRFEVSGLGMVRVEKDGVLRVVSAMLLPQENGSTHTDIEPEHVNRALFDLRHSEGDLRWWWHSHVQMGVFWSSTDHDTIKKIGAGGWMSATVFNQKNEVKSCYYSADGQRTPWGFEPLMLDDLSTKIAVIDDPRIVQWDAEYERNVKIKPVETWTPSRGWEGEVGSLSALGESGKTTGSETGTDFINDFDESVSPPLVRPKGMSKRKFKAWNSAHVAFKCEQLKLANPLKPTKPIVGLADESWQLNQGELDVYGFTPEERQLFSKEGWTDNDVDELLDADITPGEMVTMAKLGVGVKEVIYLLDNEYDASDIKELLDQSTAFGTNLFDTPSIYTRGRHE
jgi:hypothetical protein